MENLTFTNGRSADHLVITPNGVRHLAAWSRFDTHIVACTGRSMNTTKNANLPLEAGAPTCKACLRLQSTGA